MDVLICRHLPKVLNNNCLTNYSNYYVMKSNQNLFANSICIQKRHSRQSVAKYKQLMRLKRDFIIEKSDPNKMLSIFESPITSVETIDGKPKTSITVDILGSDTLPKITEWRKMQLISRARRLLPLPVSLTGLADGEMPRFWRQLMTKSLFKLNERAKYEEVTTFEKMPPSLRLFIDNFPEKVQKQYPFVYESYVKSKQQFLDRIENNEKQLLLKKEQILQFPYELVKETQNISVDREDDPKNAVKDIPRFQSGLIDTEYKDYLKHHNVMQYFASTLKGIKHKEYEGEIEGWRDQFWMRNYGRPDPSVPTSNVGCSGCGAHLHCTDNNIPGYIPSEKFKSLTQSQLRREQCQRCEFLNHFNVSLNVNVSPDQYPKLIAEIQNKKAMVIIMVDLLDFPCSVWPGIVNLIGQKQKIYIVGNKVDLLPKDGDFYLERILETLHKSLRTAGVDRNTRIRDISLISAKTGYGVESLITKLFRDHKKGEDIYLIGCTNVGKSTLFNALLQSDLCKLRDRDLINRATTSLWPGTTLNLIKFPIKRPFDWELQLRLNRLKVYERDYIKEQKLKWTLFRQTRNAQYATLSNRIGMTYRSEVPFTVQSGHPFAHKTISPKPFDQNNQYFKDCNFFYDTPGTIYKDQILTLLTTEELLKTIPREMITPRTFTLRPLQSLFIGGLARIDLAHARQQVWFTVFASHYLPIHVVHTEEAKRFYETYLGTDILAVPMGGYERVQHWPTLLPKEIVLEGIKWNQSCADVVLSTAGWVAVTFGPDTQCVLRAFTPEGRGIYVRKPPLLPFAVNLRGKRIVGTPCFENKLFTIDDLTKDSIPRRFHKNEEELHITDKRFDKIFNRL